MPSQTLLIRAHARTIHTRPITFICAQCQTMTTRECYPGKMPQYCLSCRPRKKKTTHVEREKGMFQPTYYLVAPDGRKTEVCLEKNHNPGWKSVRTALDWFSGSSIIQYHSDKGLMSHDTPLDDYSLIPIPEEEKSQLANVSSNGTITQKKSKKSQDSSREIELVEDRPYSNRQLMKRFKCGDRLLTIKRQSADFAQWSNERDPEGIAWKYEEGKFVPLPDAKNDGSAIISIASIEHRSYTVRELMKRFKCGDRLLKIKRELPEFSDWSRERDPEGISWQYLDGKFLPQKPYGVTR